MASARFDKQPAGPATRPGVFWELMRPFTLLAPAVGFFSGAVMGAGGWPPESALLGVVAAVLLNAAANVTNQCFDREIDRINKPYRPLPEGRVRLSHAGMFGGLLYAGALLLAYLTHLRLLAIFAPAAVITLLYSAPPVRLKRHALSASLAMGVCRGCLLMVAGWASVEPVWHPAPWFVGGVFGLYIFGAGNTKDFADVKGDRAYGIRTLPVLFGPRRAALMISPFLVVPFLLIPVGMYRGWVPAPAIGLTALALWGGYIGWLMLVRSDTLDIELNHVSWKHMYLLLITGQVGFAGAFLF